MRPRRTARSCFARPGLHPALALPLLLAPLACPRAPRTTGPDPRAPCATLDPAACARARALVAAATIYADEQHDFVLATARSLAPGTGLVRSAEGWRPLRLACAREKAPATELDPQTVAYSFVGVAVDSTLVSADADLGPLLGRASPSSHDVRLVAIGLVRDLAPHPFEPTPSLDVTARGDRCACGDATHFAGTPRFGALISFDVRVPRDAARVRAIDFVRGALGDPSFVFRESRLGALTIDGLDASASGARGALRFHVRDPVPLAYEASPLPDLCDFPAPEVSPSPLDFGVTPYGKEARRTVHVVNRSPEDLHALLGASTFVVPARGAIDLPLRWTPDGDAPGCETQTRDEVIPFLRANRDPARTPGSLIPRTARVLETIRTGRSSVERVEHIDAAGHKLDPAATVRDWTCPPDFARTACRAENVACADGRPCKGGGYGVVAEARGENGCHFACPRPSAGAAPPFCRFDAVMACALHCPP